MLLIILIFLFFFFFLNCMRGKMHARNANFKMVKLIEKPTSHTNMLNLIIDALAKELV